MQVDELLYLLDYTVWADERALNAARNLSAEQLHRNNSMGFGSAFETLAHILAAQKAWLLRWQGTSPTALIPASEYRDLDALKAAWDTVHADYRAFISGLDSERLNGNVSYKSTKGEPFNEPLLWLILHVFNHSTEHRSQVVAVCNLAGIDTGPFDMTYYLRNVAAPQS